MKTINIFVPIIYILSLLTMHVSYAQDNKAELAQEAANPIANLMSFPFQNNIDFGYGEYDRARNVLNIDTFYLL